ncbi:MAG: PIN domain-containing protein [Candidatus Omnitrophica bacterium]|nr:PIN domain-containing protein [Candidatus Omnitrophota bacterium]
MLIPEYWRSNLINAVVEKEKCSTEQARKRVAGQPKIYIKKHYTYVKKADEKLQAFFKRYKKKIKIKESSEAISKKALMVMGKYSLDSYDAIHIATMQQDSFTHFATGDNHIIDSCKEDFDVWTYPCGSVLNEIYYMCLGSSAYKILSNNQ